MQILVIAPVPTSPATQGSRQRARDIARAFQAKGDSVTLLYWTGELPEPGSIEAMEADWDDVQIVSSKGHVRPAPGAAGFGIDDWYHPAIGRRIAALLREQRFDACVVNYVWLSRALLALPDDCVKIIDLHDLFGDRAETFRAIGLRPDWFHTSIAEERRGFERADLLVAIQAEEAEEARRRTSREIMEVGFLSRPWPAPQRARRGDLVFGYLASANGFNVASISAFCDALGDAGPMPGVRFVAAGPVCDALAAMLGNRFELLGRVTAVEDFYRGIDCAINPMLGGTGLKIKTVEALGHGVAMVGTRAAFAGIESDRPEHGCETMAAMVAAIAGLGREPDGMDALRAASVAVFDRYIAAQQAHFAALHARITTLASRAL